MSWISSIFCCCNRKPIIRREIKLGCFGTGGSGKSTFLKILKGEDPRNVMSVNGFTTVDMDFDENFELKVYDVGGDKGIRGIWSNYYGEVHGIIFVVDFKTDETLAESIETLHTVINHPHVQKKPLYVLVNVLNGTEFDDVNVWNMLNIAGEHKTIHFAHMYQYKGTLDNINRTTKTVSQLASKETKSSFRNTFVHFIESIALHYKELDEGVKEAELALRIKQEAAKEQRRLMQMKVEHDAIKADVAALEGRPLPVLPDLQSANESPPLSLASSTIPSDIIQGSPEVTSPHDPVKISQTSTKPVSPQSNEEQKIEPPQTILKDNYFLPPKTPGRQFTRIQRIQNVLSSRVAPK